MTSDPAHHPVESVAIYGAGLSLWLGALALDRWLPDIIRITAIETTPDCKADILYGTLCPPQTYELHRSLGIDEPDFLQSTQSGFAYGSARLDWAGSGRSWVQAFHAPLPNVAGVPLSKLVAAEPMASLQALLIGAEATKTGVFAHPPEDPTHPLARAEYGYLVDPRELAAFYRSRCSSRVNTVQGQAAEKKRDGDTIVSIILDDGQTVSADLWIDASGPDAALRGPADTMGSPSTLTMIETASDRLARPAPIVRSSADGWTSTTHLRGKTLACTVSGSETEAQTTLAVCNTAHENPWQGNTLAIGQAAASLEPLTDAPVRCLHSDIRRLGGLFPLTRDMQVEAREYNATFGNALESAQHFHRAHFDSPLSGAGRYWEEACRAPLPECAQARFERRMRQFAERAYLVSYDDELYDEGDWAILHDGMGRKPARKDALADAADGHKVLDELRKLRAGMESILPKMPPHPIYMDRFLSYLERKAGTRG